MDINLAKVRCTSDDTSGSVFSYLFMKNSEFAKFTTQIEYARQLEWDSNNTEVSKILKKKIKDHNIPCSINEIFRNN